MPDVVFLAFMPRFSPRVPVQADRRYVKHVHCDGARFHVISHHSDGMKCSEPRCIMNKPATKEEVSDV